MRPTSRRLLAAVAPLAIVAAAATTDAQPDSHDDHDMTEPITVEFLTPRSQFPDEVSARFRVRPEGARRPNVFQVHDPSHAVVARITLQPGAQFPWHYHPGPVLVTVAEGQLVLTNADDCVNRPYPAGTAFVEPTRKVHTAGNPTGEETVIIATYLDAPATGPLMVAVDPADCDLAAGFSR